MLATFLLPLSILSTVALVLALSQQQENKYPENEETQKVGPNDSSWFGNKEQPTITSLRDDTHLFTHMDTCPETGIQIYKDKWSSSAYWTTPSERAHADTEALVHKTYVPEWSEVIQEHMSKNVYSELTGELNTTNWHIECFEAGALLFVCELGKERCLNMYILPTHEFGAMFQGVVAHEVWNTEVLMVQSAMSEVEQNLSYIISHYNAATSSTPTMIGDRETEEPKSFLSIPEIEWKDGSVVWSGYTQDGLELCDGNDLACTHWIRLR